MSMDPKKVVTGGPRDTPVCHSGCPKAEKESTINALESTYAFPKSCGFANRAQLNAMSKNAHKIVAQKYTKMHVAIHSG